MLERCHVYVVGKDEEHDYSLARTAGTLGFTSVSRLFRKGVPRVDEARARLSFFLVHHLLEDQALRSVIAAVRRNESDLIRFAPLVMLLDDGPFELVLRYVRLGFDDVIALPERRELVASRFCTQLDQEFTYFETPSYLGPDRRRMEWPSDSRDERRIGQHPYTRYTIIRNVDKGVRVLRKEVFGDAGAAPARQTAALHGRSREARA